MTPDQHLLTRIIAAAAEEYDISPADVLTFEGEGKAKHYRHADAVRLVMLTAHLFEINITTVAAVLRCRPTNVSNRIRNAPKWSVLYAKDIYRDLIGGTDHA